MSINKKIIIGILIVFILILGFLFQDIIRCFSQPFIEKIINETPEAKINAYLKAVMKNDERKVLEFWRLSDWKEDPLLSNRRENISKELIAMGTKDFDILNIEWWRTCCVAGVISNSQAAGGARARVKLISRDDVEYIYIFDIFHQKGAYWGAAEGCQLRHWVLRDVYPSDQEPLFWTIKINSYDEK
ncbi:MAG: hypothetical protein WBC21_02140 [Minisyncoccales bacterium]